MCIASCKQAHTVTLHSAGSLSAFEKWSGHVVPKCCRKGGLGYDFKRQRILKYIFVAEKWSGHGQTSRTADYSPEAFYHGVYRSDQISSRLQETSS